MNLENPFFLIMVMTGMTFLIFGYIMLKFPPKSINALYGYRTSRSMKNQENWDFAQIYSSKKMIKYAIAMLPFSLIGLFDILEVSLFNMFLGLAIMITCAILMIIEVETALKKKFK